MNQNVPTAPPERGAPTLPQKTAPSHGAQPNAPRKKGRGWVWFVLLAAAAVAAYYYWPKGSGSSAGTTATDSGGGGRKGGRGGVPPVVVIKATRGNIGVYDTGPGNVTPIYTVTVRTLVNGQLMNVYFKEGDLVQQGQPLAQVDPRPFQVQLEEAQGQLTHDQALLDNARVDEKRYETLLAQNAIPEQQLATQKALVVQYEGTVKADQGVIDSAKLNLTYCNITAPITGRIGLRLVDPGNIVHTTDSTGLLVITQIQPISVIFTIAEDKLPAVMDKMRAHESLRVDAWNSDESKKLATGILSTIDNEIDNSTGTLRLRAIFDNKDNVLFPNELVNARLLVEEKRNVVLLNTAAVQRTSSTPYVWLVNPDNTVTEEQITVGTTEADETEVTSGLAAGDVVVMTGVDKLNDGTKVKIETPTGSAGGRGAAASGAPVNIGDVPIADAAGDQTAPPAAAGNAKQPAGGRGSGKSHGGKSKQ